ncbi:MAG: DUF5686 and carboxypeptidase regulatory-like domain-containing protein [Paludibacter sp.]|jgi:hypothetical protein|nr:DUF5686 and carboxypeptidase regulatory-like domain-containing protein [Paludibacter sp.]
MSCCFRFFILEFCLLLTFITANAQNEVVGGIVRSKSDKQPLAFVSVYFKDSNIATQTDENGVFTLKADTADRRLVFSCIGFKTEEIKVQGGKTAWVQIEMKEEDILLTEVFVVPGENPALEFMRRVRLMRHQNDVVNKIWYRSLAETENLILLDRLRKTSFNRKIFEQLNAGNLTDSDTTFVAPLFMQKTTHNIEGKNSQILSDSIYSSKPEIQNITKQITSQIDRQIDFYDNTITLFDKAMISPLSAHGNLYYTFYLRDSILIADRKLYEVSFKSKNQKNLAFVGKMRIDSATLSIAEIEVILPPKANINFVNSLKISQTFSPDSNNFWLPQSETVEFAMDNEIFVDSLHPHPQILIKRNSNFDYAEKFLPVNQQFANSGYTAEHLNEKLDNLNNTPIMRTARWLADIVLTGYVPVGIFDFGKIENFARLTDVEGFRLTVPLRTNEHLWKNLSLEGYLGYGFKNKKVAYSFSPTYRLPAKHFHALNATYTSDYRKIDYEYNNFLLRENPLQSGDEDITASLLSLKTSNRINRRREISISSQNNWTDNFETRLILRNNTLYSDSMWLPMDEKKLQYSSATLALRFSFNEATYIDHIQQIYASNSSPVIYLIGETGKYKTDDKSQNFTKVKALMRHNINTSLGRFRYIAEAGWVSNNAPYPLLEIPDGNSGGGYSFYRFGLINRMEYAANYYANLHSEMLFNGIIFNQIPLIKYLNFREMATFKMAYGKLDYNAAARNDLPTFLSPMDGFYAEAGIGVANIMRFLTIQSVWRLTDRKKTDIRNWGLLMSVMITF